MYKPIDGKNYGSIPHLPGSNTGDGDHVCNLGQARIATEKTRDKYDRVFVTEKLDGSNVGAAKIDNVLYFLSRAGWVIQDDWYEQLVDFKRWGYANYNRFDNLLSNGERAVGEWMTVAHGTRYTLWHEPFVLLDIIADKNRLDYETIRNRAYNNDFMIPHMLNQGYAPMSIKDMNSVLSYYGYHGANDQAEGAVWRVERFDRKLNLWQYDFAVKYVRPEFVPGKYLNLDKDPDWAGPTYNDYV